MPRTDEDGVMRKIDGFGSGVGRIREDATSGAVVVKDFDAKKAIDLDGVC
jgi:hypothetical protein